MEILFFCNISIAFSILSNFSTINACSLAFSTKPYIYSRFISLSAKTFSAFASPPGVSETSTATTGAIFAIKPFSFKTFFAFSVSFSTTLNIPNSGVSAMVRAFMLMLLSPNKLQTLASLPFVFSIKIDTWLIVFIFISF